MTWTEPTLFDAIEEAEQAIADVEANADEAWMAEADRIIQNMTAGTHFIGEDVIKIVNERGFLTHDLRAMGPIIQRNARAGHIFKTGEYRAARTSHGSPKPIWEKRREG